MNSSGLVTDFMNVGIVGYGKMGETIFKWLAQKPLKIVVLMKNEEKAEYRQEKYFQKLMRSLKRGAITEEEFHEKMKSLKFSHQMKDLSNAKLVIETICEDYDKKAEILKDIELTVDENAFIVTNTSSLSIEKLAENLENKNRFCGLHFFHPVMLIDLVEIIKWNGSSIELIRFLRGFCEFISKKAIVVCDAPGSVINGILAFYYLEALYLLEEGYALPSKIDEIAKYFCYIGPCESMDIVGIDFLFNALKRSLCVENSYNNQSTKIQISGVKGYTRGTRKSFCFPNLLNKLIAENRLGKKVEKGIYDYHMQKPFDEKAEFYINPDSSHLYNSNHVNFCMLGKRLLFSVFNGALYCLNKKLSSSNQIDCGVREALQMSEGPFSKMKKIGEDTVSRDFQMLSKRFGDRFMLHQI